MWEQKIKCIKCKKFLKIGENGTFTRCEKCGQEYNTIDDELYHATACSATDVFYEIYNNFRVRRIHFHNQPLDLLDEAVQNTTLICSDVKDPYVLAIIVRKYHDALKKRLQLFLALKHISILNQTEKDNIEGDTSPNSILNLMDYLKRAFPSEQAKIQNLLNKHGVIIKRMKWIRDKSEHPLMKLWPIPGNIYEDRSEQPDSKNAPKDCLLYNFVLKVNNAVIDSCILLLDLDPVFRDKEQYKTLSDCRITT